MESTRSSVLARLRSLDLVRDPASNSIKNSSLDQDNLSVLDNSYIESALFSLFKIDIINYIKVKSILAKEFHIQPSEIDKMPAWEYELFMQEINNLVKEENERNQKEMDKSGYSKMNDPNYMKKMANNQMPKTDNSFKMPSMPKF
jgi:hypothetical protein